MARNRTPGSGAHRNRVTAKKRPLGQQGIEAEIDGAKVVIFFHTGLSVTGFEWHWQDAKMVAEVISEAVERARSGMGAPEQSIERASGLVVPPSGTMLPPNGRIVG